MVDVHAFTLEEDGKDGDFKICKLSESPACVMTYNLTASPGLKNSVFPDDGTANRNIRILNNFGTVCYLDFEERKGMIGVFAGIFSIIARAFIYHIIQYWWYLSYIVNQYVPS